MLELCPFKLSGWGTLTGILVIVILKSPNPILSLISMGGIIIAAYWVYSGRGYTETETVYGLEFTDVRTVSRRTDREHWFHLYEITFSATTKTAEIIETDNILTLTGKEVKETNIHTRDIWLPCWQGWDIDDQSVKNKIVYDCFKRNPHWNKFGISILKCVYKGEQRK